MITREGLNRLYEKAIENPKFKREDLIALDFLDVDVREMIKEGVLKKGERGYYIFIGHQEMAHYADKLIGKDEKEKQIKAYNLALNTSESLETDPEYTSICEKMFYIYLTMGKNKEAFNYFKKMYKLKNGNTKHNFWLVLLSKAMDLPDEYLKIIPTVKESLKTYGAYERGGNISCDSAIEQALGVQRFFKTAYETYDSGLDELGEETLDDSITLLLLFKANEREKKDTNLVVRLIHEKNYKKLVQALVDKKNQQGLDNSLLLVLRLGFDYVNIDNYDTIYRDPGFEDRHPDNKFLDAIENGDYQRARTIREMNLVRRNKDPKGDMFLAILDDLIVLKSEKRKIFVRTRKKD